MWSRIMAIFNDLIQKCRDAISGYQLSLSGEITICNKSNTQLLTLLDEERVVIHSYMDALQKRFPFLSVSCNENLVEISIKMFAYEKYMSRENFLEELRSELAGIISTINEGERFQCRLSVSGILADRNKKSKFIMLSKQSLVEYKIVQQEKVSGISKIAINRMSVMCVSLIAIILIAYIIYQVAFVIPGHDPDKLLHNALDVFEVDENVFTQL